MVHEVGRLCFDVEVKNVKVHGKDRKVINNRIAIPITKDKSTFVDIEAWDKNAERIMKYYQKGYEICITGHLINKDRKKGDVEYETTAILVDRIIPTYGNPKPYNFDSEDFLKPEEE